MDIIGTPDTISNLILERMKLRHRVLKQFPKIKWKTKILSQVGGLQMAINQGFVIFFAPLSPSTVPGRAPDFMVFLCIQLMWYEATCVFYSGLKKQLP